MEQGRAKGNFNRMSQHSRRRPTAKKPVPSRPKTNVKSVQIPERITVKEFAQAIEVSASEVIKKLIALGVMASINQEIDADTATLVGAEFGVTVEAAPTDEEALVIMEIEDRPESLKPRWPVVTIMGHVDHGKTSLLDAIRETNVIASEAGGITQHIGAYQVDVQGKKVTFLDTPGHEAFTAMRARGAQVTDIAVLVVAADDGVMPQTVEAINHGKAAEVPIIVAINKIDKPVANPDRVKQELTQYGLVPEEWGGDTICVEVSALKKIGLDDLLEMILLVAEMRDLKANPNRPAKGTVIEAKLDKGRGPVATVLVQNGTLHQGDTIIAGDVSGKIRVLVNDKGKNVAQAGPSEPVEVVGFADLPEAGDIFYVTDEKTARQLAEKRQQFRREKELKKDQRFKLEDLFVRIKEGEIRELNIVLKADVQGSIEAIQNSLERLSNEEVRVRVIHGGVGAISESDVMLASASGAVIVGFNVRPDPIAKRLAEREEVDLRLYRIIYNIIDDVKKAMEGMLEPEFREVVLGRAEVRATFRVPKAGTVAGSYVTEGKITRNSEARIIRDNVVIYEGKIESLRRFKDDVREVVSGFECGIGLERFNDIKEGDIIECFTNEEIKKTNGTDSVG
jgi:translation initiation factor IF-2